ncbi:Mov34/MPN/PAD-1 family protein [Bacillus cereus group sp. BCN31]|uniref:Mov34/MPN/PAD-1 family protein n=1 Tax=unclassified Bacillus cereus group TaxID=2750818 RepID=UPI003F7A7CAD
MKTVIYNIGSNERLKISNGVLEGLKKYRQFDIEATEAGGVLLGRFLNDSNDVIIDSLTEPLEKDIRKRCYFKKHLEDHQKMVDKIWRDSKGTCNYLGEWHTHPEKHPTPSWHDKREWRKVLKNTKCDSKTLFFVIVGTESIGVWIGSRTELKIEALLGG